MTSVGRVSYAIMGENVGAPRKVLSTPAGTTCKTPDRDTDRKGSPLLSIFAPPIAAAAEAR